jgi:hypothetical protein
MKRDRKEISRLKREVLQLRKLLKLKEQQEIDRRAEVEQEEEDERANRKRKDTKEPQDSGPRCPKCKGDMELLDLGRYTYKVCTNRSKCWHRERMK